ncbi:energy transducer TonB [Sphingosinicella sp. LHD-64]|uniref:energy transducer TonB n=1 Tax=Sphingosinicella sp. LHD-64 TaxID=3072139 RepID=UPI00280F5A8A|nr:energy transducer TonB [Sphingosinicella sp. LHD-64]MDQ8756668.1 energy transducer TonB [Sphingosinicella sp. LHD-64]
MKAAILLLAIIAAQTAPTPAPEEGARWQVDWGQQMCSLVRTRPGATPIDFAIQIVPGSGSADLILGRRDDTERSRIASPVVIALAPNDMRFETEMVFTRGSYTTFRGLKPDFLNRFAAAREIQVLQNGGIRASIPVPSTEGVIAAVGQCLDSVQAQWGIDAARLATLRQWPELDRPWVHADDYPTSALRANVSGQTILRLTIDAEGRITGCTTIATSGNEALDRASCANVSQGRFRPALDQNGAPIAVEIAMPIRWTVH